MPSACRAAEDPGWPGLGWGRYKGVWRGLRQLLRGMGMFTISTVSWLHKYVIMHQMIHF